MKGGKVYGKWSGLAPEQLKDWRHLSGDHGFPAGSGRGGGKTLGLRRLETVFPGAAVDPGQFLNFI